MNDLSWIGEFMKSGKEIGAEGALLLVICILLFWIRRELMGKQDTLKDLVKDNTESNIKMAEAVNKSTDRADAFMRSLETVVRAFERERR